jgi:superfamily II DNA or RNA helicase
MTEPTRIKLKKKPASQAAVASQAVVAAVADASVPPVRFEGDRMAVTFDRFDLPTYQLFLRCKALPESEVEFHPATESYTLSAPARFAPLLGVTRPAVRESFPLASFLFPDQKELTAQALDCKRFALWCLCGYGKTLCGWEFGRQASLRTGGGRALIVTTNDLVPQWIEEAERFYGDTLPVVRLRSREQLREWCKHGTVNGEPTAAKLAITNYEKFNPDKGDIATQIIPELKYLVCVILDEASRLRNSGGKQKWSLIKSCKGIEYKLLLTATPAPNDLMEFASQAAFLEKMRSEGDIIWTFFTRNEKTHRWDVKPHARTAFFEFMANWSIYVHNPKRYGWRLDHPDVPPPEYRVVEIPATEEQLEEIPAAIASAAGPGGQMTFVADASETNAIQRLKLSEIAKGFKYVQLVKVPGAPKKGRRIVRIPSNKPAAVAKIVREEVARGEQVLVWTLFDEETDILAEQLDGLAGVEVLTGSVKAGDRPAMINRFKAGETRVLVTRAKMLGYGMNLQMCGAMVFSGFSDSFEDVFQAVHRAVRHGQTQSVRVYFPLVRELEGDVMDNLDRKRAEYMASVAEMEGNYVKTRERLALARGAGAA